MKEFLNRFSEMSISLDNSQHSPGKLERMVVERWIEMSIYALFQCLENYSMRQISISIIFYDFEDNYRELQGIVFEKYSMR